MLDFILALNPYIWIADLLILGLLGAVTIKQKQLSSSLTTQALIVIVSGAKIQCQSLINEFVSPHASQMSYMFWLIGFCIFTISLLFGLYCLDKDILTRKLKNYRVVIILASAVLIGNIVYLQYLTLTFEAQTINYKIWIISAFYLGISLIDGLAIYAIYKLHQMMQTPHLLLARMYILAFSVTATLQVLRFNQKLIFESNLYQDAYQMAFAGINIGTTIVAIVVALLALYQTFVQGEKGKLSWKY